jgi:hypothetical protein
VACGRCRSARCPDRENDYADEPDPPCERILRVFVYKLRRKLAPHGFTIVTRWGHGLMMPVEQRARLRAAALK